ncbi:uncharacterized protein LOC117053461 isoform X2 [Lacerta agilis]|uniref:uncharacterized protein LOC117053461 isoform X2 n=1 Tax=Lacerta agilis TaxID=80427 RepID=UPI00141A42D8|nr:uncharacterized protein LOC117053461 isoform X2 [Lacerta agilis]
MVRVLPSGAAGSEPAPVFHRAALPILAHGAMPLPLSLAGWGPHPSEEQAGVALLRREGARRFCLQKPAGWASRGLQLAGWLMGRAPAWHREGAPGSGAMEAPREDVLQSSWVEVPLLGQEEPPTPACAPHRDMEQILLEAQLEVESPRAEGSFLALKAPGVEDLSPGQREDTEGSVQMGTLPWSWPSLPEHQNICIGKRLAASPASSL